MSNKPLFLIEGPAELEWSMGTGVPGSMDGLIFTSDWRKKPNNVPLKDSKLYLPQGTPLPIKKNEIQQELPENSMFMLSKNVSSPYCCPSTFSSSGGCICTTPYQRKYVARMRGSNNSWNNNF